MNHHHWVWQPRVYHHFKIYINKRTIRASGVLNYLPVDINKWPHVAHFHFASPRLWSKYMKYKNLACRVNRERRSEDALMSITEKSVPRWRPIRPDPRAPLDSWRREPVPGDCRAGGRGQSENGLDKSSFKYILQVNMEETYLRRDMPWKTYWQCRSATSL